MTDATKSRLAHVFGAVNFGLCLMACVILLPLITSGVPTGETWGFPGSSLLYGVTLTAVAWLLSARRPGNPIGWLFMVAATCAVALALGEAYGTHLIVKRRALYGFKIVNWASSGIWIPMFGAIALVLAIFPTGSFRSRRWRFLAWAIPISTLWAFVLESFTPGSLDKSTGAVTVTNPFGIEALRPLLPLRDAGPLPLVLCMFAAAASIAFRMKGSAGDERTQLKWLSYSGFFLGASLIAFWVAEGSGSHVDLAESFNAMAVASIPVAAAVAIFKYRLYDIDVLINRTLVYGVLTAALGAVYFGMVLVIGQLIGPITSDSNVAIAGATVAVFVVFRPVRERVQAFIDKRFYRSKYNATQALEELEVTLRDEVDRGALAQKLADAARDTLQTASAVLIDVDPADPAVSFLTDADEAVSVSIEFDSPLFENVRAGGARLLIPLVTHGELVGALAVGPRLSGQDYSSDDRRFLERLAALAAPVFRISQLVQEQEVAARAKERVEQELRVATLIQQQFLPTELPEHRGLHIAAYYKPAREVGGDFYDFIELDDHRLMVVVGDVTDKGVPAALVMATTRCILRIEAQRAASPAALLAVANEFLCRDTPESMFVTCLCFVIDPARGEVMFANAGHNLPYVARSGKVIELRATGMPLGLLPSSRYDDQTATLEPGDRVLLCSDGLVEAHNEDRELFGFPRTKSSLGEVHKEGPGAVIDHLLTELGHFLGDHGELEDDITMVALEYSASAARAFVPEAVTVETSV